MSSQLVEPVPHILEETDDKDHKNSFKPLAAVMHLDLVESPTDFHVHADLPGNLLYGLHDVVESILAASDLHLLYNRGS